MRYFIDKTNSAPAYLQLYDQLRQDIISGQIRQGEKLPSKRLIAEELDLSLITVEHSYALLMDEGYVVSRQRSGYFASFGADMPARPIVTEIPVSEYHSDFPFSVFAKTMRRVLNDYDSRILAKAPNNGCPEFRHAIASYLERSRGIHVNAGQIIIGSGAEYLYGLAAQLLGHGCRIALEDPSYDKIRKVYEANGAVCSLLALGEDGIQSEALNMCRTNALHVTPYNSFPSGVTASAAKRFEYIQWAETTQGYIIEDDYDSEFSSVLRQVSTIYALDPKRVIYINTFSRTVAPGMRIGYMILPEPLLKRYEQELSFYSCTVPVFEQYVLAEFINSGEFERHINRRRRKLRQSAKT